MKPANVTGRQGLETKRKQNPPKRKISLPLPVFLAVEMASNTSVCECILLSLYPVLQVAVGFYSI